LVSPVTVYGELEAEVVATVQVEYGEVAYWTV
jgi:hypothetical protein